MLLPKRVKYRRVKRGRMTGKATRGNVVCQGQYGLVALEPAWISSDVYKRQVKGIIGKKVGMTQLFDENGKVVPVTVIEAGPCTVVQKKTVESDGYQEMCIRDSSYTSVRPYCGSRNSSQCSSPDR